ncbi:MAG: lipoprotein transmembrane [Burkholderiales bacterium RIFCSPLOWO2_12_FULL_61_40]|nr:MAG: lipoprotein transmembrane [Burkholderiales bacterium RIFCSPLOWO2_12_FULL_61_40]
MAFGFKIGKLLPLGLLALACAMPAQALEVSGVKVDDAAMVGGKELKLNGAGMRAILFVKFYAIGLYLTEKKTTPTEVQALTGPRRISLTIQREINSDEFGQLFITSMNKNSTKEEKAKVISQTVKFGEMFAAMEPVKKGDIVTLDWIPGTGTVSSINGKKIGETLPDIAFYNAVMRIWLGEMPAQENVKRELLGGR